MNAKSLSENPFANNKFDCESSRPKTIRFLRNPLMKLTSKSNRRGNGDRKSSFAFFGVAALAAMFACAPDAPAAPYVWNVPSGNWSSPGSWNPNTIGASGPYSTDTVIFNNTAVSSSSNTINNIVDSGFPGSVLNFTNGSYSGNTASYTFEVTDIPTGKSLTVSNQMFIGGVNMGTTSGNPPYATYQYMVGGGTLDIVGPSLIVQNYGSAAGANDCAYLNLSGLTNFIYNNSNGAIAMAGFVPSNYASGSQGTRQGGSMILASGSNSITASAINLGTSGVAQAGPSGALASGTACQLTLGSGANVINLANFNIAAQKNPFTVTNSGGTLRIRGMTGADSDSSANITIGNRNVGGGTGQTTGQLLLNGCAVDIKAGTLIVGQNSGGAPSSAADGGNGVLQFDTGTISANSLLMAYNTSANNGANQAQCTGVIQVGAHATLLIGAGQLFNLATAASSGPASGTLLVSNGLVNCQGPIGMGVSSVTTPADGTATGTIQLLGGATLNMGPNSYIGTIYNPVTALILDTNSTLSVSIPSVSYTNVCVDNLTWPTPDNNLTISVAAMPAGISSGAVFPFLNYSSSMSGTFNSPNLLLPPGVQGYLSLSGNSSSGTMFLTITAGVGPGTGGVDQLLNPYFSQGTQGTNWATEGAAMVVSTNSTYPNTGTCTSDTRSIVPLQGTGTNVAMLTGSFVPGGSTNELSQSVSVAPGSTVTAGGFTYVAHEDIMSGADSFYYEMDFVDANGSLLAAYESAVLTNLTCGSPIVDNWDLMAVTNQMEIVGGANSGIVASNVAPIIQVPPQTARALFKAVFIQRNASDSGAVYISGANLGLLTAPVPPSLSAVTPNLITLCTNNFLTCTATSTVTTISGVQVTATTTSLGGLTTNTTIYTTGSPGLTVSGLGTSSANISLALETNIIYSSVVLTVTDADNLTVSSSPVSFDTLSPDLVIEASDFNFTSNGVSGLFIDTPPNGGLALYTNQVGMQGIDENKITRAATQSYYRPNDATIIQAASSTSGVEQKFVTSAANGDTNDIEVAIAYDTPGDWQNYSRTFNTTGTFSAAPGTYNVWCRLATTGSGPQLGFYQVTSNPGATGQTTNFIGNFGSSSFSDNSYYNFVYAPLVDQFGNRVTLTITNGVQTFRSQILSSDTPNVGFYILEPVAPVYTPVFLNVYPNGPLESSGELTFSVGPAQGASILTNGISLIINGVSVTSGLTFTPVNNGGWTVNYAIQSNAIYSVTINATNTAGLTAVYTNSFDTFNINNFHWMAVDYDFSTNNGTGSGGSVGDGWTGDLFIDNPQPTGDANAPTDDQTWQFTTNSYFGYPSGLYPGIDPSGYGALAEQGIDVNWNTNATQDTDGMTSNSIYRGATVIPSNPLNGGDGIGTQVASDSFLLPEFLSARTNILHGRDGSSGGPDVNICEFNVGYFYTNDWLNYTRTYPTGTFNVWGRMAAGGGAFSGCALSLVTSGVGTSNQTTQVLGTFSDPNPGGWQTYHWIPLVDTNGNPVYLQLSGKATLRLTAPPTAGTGGGGVNPLFFMLAPAVSPALAFDISASIAAGNIQITIPTQTGHTYMLMYSASLSSPNWTQVGATITGDGTVHVVNEPSGSGTGFYRVEAQ